MHSSMVVHDEKFEFIPENLRQLVSTDGNYNASRIVSTQWPCLPLIFPYYQTYLLHDMDA